MERVATGDIPAFIGGREGEGRRALITGLRGFTGYYMAQELSAAGYRVYGTVMPGEELGPDIFPVDLCDREAVAAMVDAVQPDVVAHLAGIAFVAHTNAELMYRVNVVGTRNLLEALAEGKHRPTSVLLASSANIYGNASVPVIDENVAPSPANDYAVSKLAMEYMARLWMDKLPITIARPFNYTGIGQAENFLLPKIVSHFRRNEARIELGNLAIARDFSDVRMVARAYRRLMAVAPGGEAFNVCSGSSHSLASLIDMMGDIAGYRIDVHVNPAFVRANDVLTLTGSNSKLTAVIGQLDPTPLSETLRWMYQA
ncbi:GDP-mannose 4,6-dehydratase [Massilia yuzhufengensis]|uniref:GDP-D-mannose dehydratase n=1 Tax=Massilia yuzhufengensis TaxID=1164594 RepID=A0A1I1UXI9_9BURK|nr:GDP-mannose 4,6-dehydratase [Massilia yuzhufengensis]SFD73543.1 GDP-D-mannose dehydratase [Massilia yuzhufengensis]